MTYTHGHHESVLRSHKWCTVDNSAAYLAPHLTTGISVLDLGCGPGTIRPTSAGGSRPDVSSHRCVGHCDRGGTPRCRRWPERRVLGRRPLRTRHGRPTFDVVHAHQVLQHLPDPVGALREMKRVCKPGGLVAARDGDYDAFRWYPDEPAIDRWLALYRKIARATRASPTRADSSWRGRTPRASTTCSWARQCGASQRQTTARGGVGCGPTA